MINNSRDVAGRRELIYTGFGISPVILIAAKFNFGDQVASILNYGLINLKDDMNIFVLSTGRCGSTSFIMACRHITNFTCAHESRTWMLGDNRFDYPKNHIEADNRLSWLLGRLDKIYGDNAIYIHLKRNENDTARSLVKRYSRGIMRAYRGGGILLKLPRESDPMAVALDYCHTVNSNIELFLGNKTKTMVINLEDINRDFPAFYKFIGAEGDISAALAEFNNHYNTRKMPPISEKKKIVPRIILKVKRLIIKLPRYFKDA
jgi:hypothetical protein